MGRNYCLSILKGIACIGIVFIHVTFPGLTGEIVKYTFKWGVPLFLMIAGYYSYECDAAKIKQRFIKSIKYFLLGFIVFFIANFAEQLHLGTAGSWISETFNWQMPILMIIFCTVGWAIPLWYLIAMSETYLFWLIIVKKKDQNKVLKAALPLLIIGTIITLLVDSIGLPWFFKIFFAVSALPWFLIGYNIRNRQETILEKVSNCKLLVIAFIGLIITLSSIILKLPIDFNYVGTVITAPALFLFGIKNSEKQFSKPSVYFGDSVSPFVYIFHVPMGILISNLILSCGTEINGGIAILYPLITVVVTIAFSILFEKIVSKLKHNRLSKGI